MTHEMMGPTSGCHNPDPNLLIGAQQQERIENENKKIGKNRN